MELGVDTMGEMLAFLALAAFFAGLVDSMAGGGGLITLPALLAAGVPPHLALGTNKVQSCLGTTFSTVRYIRHRQVHVPIALTASAFSLIGSYAGSTVALVLPSERIAALLPPLIVVVAVVTFARREFGVHDSFEVARVRHYLLAAAVGLVIGFYDGFFGPGTGTFLAFAFVLLFGFGFARANGNAKLVNLASNAAAVIAFGLSSQVNWPVALIMSIANIAGNWLGAGLAIGGGAKIIKPVFGLVLALLLFRLLLWP
ncbi:MAG: TSUP family transporter [Limnochordales bacterium]|nr:TSUP family transporter [Limnochordales bacterium]